jgi:hypothetical protein
MLLSIKPNIKDYKPSRKTGNQLLTRAAANKERYQPNKQTQQHKLTPTSNKQCRRDTIG